MLSTWNSFEVSIIFFQKKSNFSSLILRTLIFLNIFVHASNASSVFSNEWAVEIEGGDDKADAVAITHGFINHGKVSCFRIG